VCSFLSPSSFSLYFSLHISPLSPPASLSQPPDRSPTLLALSNIYASFCLCHVKIIAFVLGSLCS
jgi:hypothetical protein